MLRFLLCQIPCEKLHQNLSSFFESIFIVMPGGGMSASHITDPTPLTLSVQKTEHHTNSLQAYVCPDWQVHHWQIDHRISQLQQHCSPTTKYHLHHKQAITHNWYMQHAYGNGNAMKLKTQSKKNEIQTLHASQFMLK